MPFDIDLHKVTGKFRAEHIVEAFSFRFDKCMTKEFARTGNSTAAQMSVRILKICRSVPIRKRER